MNVQNGSAWLCAAGCAVGETCRPWPLAVLALVMLVGLWYLMVYANREGT